MKTAIQDVAGLRQRVRVYRDREEAGRVLAGMLKSFEGTGAIVAGIPSGGVPVAFEIARALQLPLRAAVASKITPSWNTEAGYGAVAFDGTTLLNDEALPHFGVTREEIQEDTERALAKVRGRMKRFGGDRMDWRGKTVLLVDDGVAAGLTMAVAVLALRNQGAARIVVAVPTGHESALRDLAGRVDAVYCANVRGGPSFAVASAYKDWYDVPEDEAADLLTRARRGGAHSP